MCRMTALFFVVMFVTTFAMLAVTRLEVTRLIHQHHGQKVDFFKAHPVRPGDIVMVGDSLTDGARWDEIFPGLPIKNRGINADTVEGVLERLDKIIAGKPGKIFILIGTNDLPWYDYRGDHFILNTYEKILNRIKVHLPDTQVYVQSLLPRQRRYARRIRGLNASLAELAGKTQCEFIDLYPALADANGALRQELTNGHLHLLGAGYRIWAESIREKVMGKESFGGR